MSMRSMGMLAIALLLPGCAAMEALTVDFLSLRVEGQTVFFSLEFRNRGSDTVSDMDGPVRISGWPTDERGFVVYHASRPRGPDGQPIRNNTLFNLSDVIKADSSKVLELSATFQEPDHEWYSLSILSFDYTYKEKRFSITEGACFRADGSLIDKGRGLECPWP